MTERLAVWSSRRPWLTRAGWALALVASIAIIAAFVGAALSGDEEVTSATDSRRADELVSTRFAEQQGGLGSGATEVVVVRSSGATVDEPRFERRVRAQQWSVDNPDIWLEEFYVKERHQTPEDAAVVIEGLTPIRMVRIP